nr:MarR family transcriptional regulator [uncultured Sphaerochaeta sp.]
MKLEEEIKQKEFVDIFHKLAVNILYTHSWLDYHMQKRFRQFDLTSSQYNILRILKGQHPNSASINLLKERMLDKMSDASRLVERLRVKGFVDRQVSRSDRRKVEVIITQEGIDILDKLSVIEKDSTELMKNISEDDAHKLNELLDNLRG